MPAIIAGVASGAIGAASSASARNDANNARQQALQQWLQIHVPDPKDQEIELQRFQQTGSFSPTLQKTFSQDPTGLSKIVVDPTGRDAELDALTKMTGVANAGGLDAQAEAKLQQARMAADSSAKGSRDAITANMAARGMGGASGAGLQAMLQATQSDQNSTALADTQAAADAEQRALYAMAQTGNMGANLRGQDYSQAAEAAKAQDAINQFNTRNAQQVEGANTGAQTTAQAANVNMAQDVANKNTGVANTEEQFNKGLLQQQFQNQTTKAAGATGQYDATAKQDTANADRTAGQWAGIGSAISGGIGAIDKKNTDQATLDAYNNRTNAMYGAQQPAQQPVATDDVKKPAQDPNLYGPAF